MRGRILLVEDNPYWLDIIAEELAARDFEVTTAVSLRDALTLMETNPPCEVVITDIALSGSTANRDGVELLEIIRRRWPTVVTIAVSGRASKGDVDKFKERYHALDYLDRKILVDEPERFSSLVEEAADMSRRAAVRGGGVIGASGEHARVGGGGRGEVA
jgi:CheY-like chemotaxis protein